MYHYYNCFSLFLWHQITIIASALCCTWDKGNGKMLGEEDNGRGCAYRSSNPPHPIISVQSPSKAINWKRLFVVMLLKLQSYHKHWWFSGRILACHAGGPGSIPGQCNFCTLQNAKNLHRSVSLKQWFRHKTLDPHVCLTKWQVRLTRRSTSIFHTDKFLGWNWLFDWTSVAEKVCTNFAHI